MSEEEHEQSDDEPPVSEFNIILEPHHMAGVWANWGRVSQSDHEFTLDFVRLDFTAKQGIVVARVSVSPLFVTQLIEALQAQWKQYERRALPREVYGDEEEPGSDDQES